MVSPAHASAFVRCAALATAITGMQALAPRSAAAKILLFEDVTSTSGIDLKGITHSILWGDYNNDGCLDLWISKHSGDDGQAANLYRNLCNGHFVDVTKATVGDLRGILDFHGAAWADFDNDGDVDLVQLRGGGEGVGVGPNLRARLFVNSGGKLVDRAAQFGVEYPLARGRMPLWLDYDNDGKLDLFFGADHRPDGKSPPTIFHQGDRVFENARVATGFDLNICRYALISNLNTDRRMEFVTISGVEGLAEQTLSVFGTRRLPFVDLTSQFLSAVHVNGHFSEIAIADFNNDLRPDLYITRQPQTRPDQLFINTGARFVDTTLGRGGSMAVADYDNDGFLDIALTNGEHQLGSDGRIQLLHNRGNANHWLKVKLVGNSSNRDAIGATVVITANGMRQLREANGGIHRFAQDDTTIHFGVAGAKTVDRVVVRWPSGKNTVLNNVGTDRVLRVSEQ